MQAWSLFKRLVMSVWYVHVRTLNRLWPSITLEGKRLTIFPGVYKPLENEPACAEYCREEHCQSYRADSLFAADAAASG